MSKPQNPLIKLLQQLGLARFLGLEPGDTHDAKVASVEQPTPQEAAVETETSVVSSIEPEVAETPAPVVVEVEAAPVEAAPVEATTPVSQVVIDDKVAEPVETAAVVVSATPVIPEDSVLNRHYQANQQAERETITHPYPSDSVLRRHYDTEHKLVLDAQQAAVSVPVVDEAPHIEESQPVETTIVETVVEEVVASPAPAPQVSVCTGHVAVPQDSVLKRHFLQCLTAEIEAGLSPSPTDSVLRRHHAALVQSELQKRLGH